jgi:type IV pilus assembly protein PilM
MGIKDLFGAAEELIAIDLGAHSLKLAEISIETTKPTLKNIASVPVAADTITSNSISKPEALAEQIQVTLEQLGMTGKRVVTAMPAPSIFTKRLKVPRASMSELASTIQFEAGNLIPHNIDAVRLDFHVLGQAGKNQLEVLVVAVKNEIIDSYMNCFALAGVELAVVDVDFFGLQNAFEVSYPALRSKTVALLNMGARYSAINVCKGGQSIFTGDISVGGRTFTEALANGLGIPFDKAEALKQSPTLGESSDDFIAQGLLEKQIEAAAAEVNRQLSLFWNASGSEEGIDQIMLAGGAALLRGLAPAIAERTGIECQLIDGLAGFNVEAEIAPEQRAALATQMCVCLGLGLRQPGDKTMPEIEEE